MDKKRLLELAGILNENHIPTYSELQQYVEIIPVSDTDLLADYDNAQGYNQALYFDNFIVVPKNIADDYKQLIARIEAS